MVKQTWIHQTVVHIEFDGKVHMLEASSQGKACRMRCAFLLKNGLDTKFLMFFTDGEEALKTNIEKVFGGWSHALLLDWPHIEKRFLESFSKVFKSGKVVDPEATPEKFKNGKIKKGSVLRITKSKLRLREFCRILWVGDIDGGGIPTAGKGMQGGNEERRRAGPGLIDGLPPQKERQVDMLCTQEDPRAEKLLQQGGKGKRHPCFAKAEGRSFPVQRRNLCRFAGDDGIQERGSVVLL